MLRDRPKSHDVRLLTQTGRGREKSLSTFGKMKRSYRLCYPSVPRQDSRNTYNRVLLEYLTMIIVRVNVYPFTPCSVARPKTWARSEVSCARIGETRRRGWVSTSKSKEGDEGSVEVVYWWGVAGEVTLLTPVDHPEDR